MPFEYTNLEVSPRADVLDALRSAWDTIAGPGDWWTGEERVAIARETRAARRLRGLPPWQRPALDSDSESASLLPEATREAIHKIAIDNHRIDRQWVESTIEALGGTRGGSESDASYVEMVTVIVSMTAIDIFTDALGVEAEPLPGPTGGAPREQRPDGLGDAGAILPMLLDYQGPNVGRALSLSPDGNRMFFGLVRSMYAGEDFTKMVWDHRPLARPQAELMAARVSSLNECFYWTASHVTMLRASSQATGEEADLGATVGRGDGDGGVEHGEALLRFTEAINKDSEDADPARQALQAVLSPEAFLEAAAIVAIFNGLVRTADAIGIPLDESTLAASNDFLGELGLAEYASAAHTPIEATGG